MKREKKYCVERNEEEKCFLVFDRIAHRLEAGPFFLGSNFETIHFYIRDKNELFQNGSQKNGSGLSILYFKV